LMVDSRLPRVYSFRNNFSSFAIFAAIRRAQ
jgi:hypothetical protein